MASTSLSPGTQSTYRSVVILMSTTFVWTCARGYATYCMSRKLPGEYPIASCRERIEPTYPSTKITPKPRGDGPYASHLQSPTSRPLCTAGVKPSPGLLPSESHLGISPSNQSLQLHPKQKPLPTCTMTAEALAKLCTTMPVAAGRAPSVA